MKLLIGGSSSKLFHLNEFAKSLANYDIEAKVVFDADYSDGFPSRKISSWFSNSNKFKKLIDDFKPDAIFIDRQRHFGVTAVESGLPLFVHLRGNFWKEIEIAKKTLYKTPPKKFVLSKWEKMGSICFHGATVILPICNYLQKITKEHLPEKDAIAWHQGINPSNWYPTNGMKLKHPCVGLLQGAVIWDKTKEILNLKNVLKSMPNVTFYWVGDGPFRDSILSELKEFSNFISLGALEYPDKVRDFLSEIDVYALISGLDMSPLTLLEAQLMEKPLIASNVGGIPELMKDQKTGYLVECGNSNDIKEKLSLLLDNNEIAKKMGKDGRQYVIENFSWNIIAKRFADIMKQYVK